MGTAADQRGGGDDISVDSYRGLAAYHDEFHNQQQQQQQQTA